MRKFSRTRTEPVVRVDRDRCELYGICLAKAPGLFELERGGRLGYRGRLDGAELAAATAAARSCPVRAIELLGVIDG